MADSDIVWKVQGSGLSWVERDGHFHGIKAEDGVQPFDALDLEQLEPNTRKDRAPCAETGCGGLFPSDFTACPNCGVALGAMFTDKDQLWSYPSPDGDGLLNAENIDIQSIGEAISFPTPDTRQVTLVVAGQPRRLLAIDRGNSEIHIYNRQRKEWRQRISCCDLAFDMPAWSWSVLATENGFACAGPSQPLVMTLDALGTCFDASEPAEDFGKPVSGPVALSLRLLFLCEEAEGGLRIVSFNPATGGWTNECAVTGAAHKAGTYFAAPTLKLPNAFWTSAAGYVTVRATARGFEAAWRPWTEGFEPELQIRPLSTLGALWQFGVSNGSPRFEGLTRIGGPLVQPDISGPYLTAGECAFASGMTISARPWDPTFTQTVGNNDSFLMPIAGLKGMDAVVADCGYDPSIRRVNPGELLDPNATPKLARLRVYKANGAGIEMGRAIRVANILQLQAVVFDGQLLIYDSLGETIDAWTYA